LRSFEVLLELEEFVTLWVFKTTAAHHVRQGSRGNLETPLLLVWFRLSFLEASSFSF
jgi:hypothetical protein